jgi:hypothetical protein
MVLLSALLATNLYMSDTIIETLTTVLLASATPRTVIID